VKRRKAAQRQWCGCGLPLGRGCIIAHQERVRAGIDARVPIVIGEFMARRKKVYEGKAKILYEGPEPGTLIQYFKDDSAPTATDASPAAVEGKGVLNNRLSEFFMNGLNSVGVPTHFIRRVNMREQMVRMAEIVPLEIVVRNFAAGELAERLGIPEGMPLPRPIVEYYLKDDRLQLPLVAEEHIVAFNWASQQDLDDIIALSLRVNDFLSGVMLGVGIRLADFRIEVGRIWEGDFMRLIVADEITPDSCRLWDMRAVVDRGDGQPLAEPGPLPDVYTELARRLGVLPSNVTHPMKPTLIN
jgi:phosphoribosylaminoimidazole-succinocarboxamide synthase